MKRRLLEEEEFNRHRQSKIGELHRERSMRMASKFQRVQEGCVRAKKIEEEHRNQLERNMEEEARKREIQAQKLKQERDQRRAIKEERAAKVREQVRKAEVEREMKAKMFEEQFELAVAVGTARRKHNSSFGHTTI